MKKFSENDIKKYVRTITAYTLPYGFIIEADQSEEVTDFTSIIKIMVRQIQLMFVKPLFAETPSKKGYRK